MKHNAHVLTSAYHRINMLQQRLSTREIPCTVFSFEMSQTIKALEKEQEKDYKNETNEDIK